MTTILVGGDDGDLGLLVEFGDIVYCALEGAIAAHVVDDTVADDDEAITALLIALPMAEGGMFAEDLAGLVSYLDDLPPSGEFGGMARDRVGAAAEDRRRNLPPPTGGRVGNGDVVELTGAFRCSTHVSSL